MKCRCISIAITCLFVQQINCYGEKYKNKILDCRKGSNKGLRKLMKLHNKLGMTLTFYSRRGLPFRIK